MNNNYYRLDELARKFYRGRGGTLRYIPNGKLRLDLYYVDDYGRKRRKVFVGRNIGECYERANQFAADSKGLISNNKSTIPEILRVKLANDLALHFIKPQTHGNYLTLVSNIENHLIGQLPVAGISTKMIENYLEYITGRYSDCTIDALYRFLSTAFDIAVQDNVVAKNPMRAFDIRKPKSKKSAQSVRGFTEEEQIRFLRALKTYTPPYGSMSYKLQFLVQLYSGLRMGEVNALTPEDIDFGRNLIHVRNTVILLNGKSELGDTAKTYNGVRDVPICKKLKPVLQEALEKMKDNPCHLVFYDHKADKVIGTSSASSSFTRMCKRCGINLRGSHALRHTFATRCIEAGVPAVVLKKWLGHSDIHVTMDIYADVYDRMHHDAIEKLDKHISEMYND